MSTVLIVDDCLTDRRRAGGLLARADFEVTYAANGLEAVDRLGENLPDAIVTDLQMPEMDGLALVTAVTRDHPFVPVVVVTSQGSESVAVQALQAGAASYVPKRDLASQLVEAVRRVCLAAGENRDFARLAERVIHHQIRYELESDLSLIPPAVRAVRESLAGFRKHDESGALRVAIAFEEALLNAFYHGNLEVRSELRDEDPNDFYELAKRRCDEFPYRDRKVTVDVAITPQEVRFRVADEGPGFDPASLPDPTDPENIARASGRGLLLIRTFMDEVAHNIRGNEIAMLKRFGHQTGDVARPISLHEPEHVT
ncbi:MAG: response regulator [Planctomycetota bacterium]|nr:response regulator [Planctomycetaceae bacterium]MDQ3329828.1 response regulator [Planctomycetota bacterium]